MMLKITDVRVLPGDCAFLLDDGRTAVLYDTGFGFTGARMVQNIQRMLGNRPLDYILLTHSHYDHVLGACHIAKAYPGVKIIAGEYVQKIFAKPTARATMHALDRSAARKEGMADYEDLSDQLRVDIVVRDGDEIACGDMKFEVVGLPGHTKCSVGFYMKENRLLLGTETLGVYLGDGVYLPSYLVGYQMTLDSFAKAAALDFDSLLIPHYGVVSGEAARDFLSGSERAARSTAEKICEIFAAGGTKEDAFAWFKETIYIESVRPAYPIEAFNLNTGILMDLVRRELMGK